LKKLFLGEYDIYTMSIELLFASVRSCDLPRLRWSLYCGIDVNCHDQVGETALHIASSWNQVTIITELLAHPDIDPNTPTYDDSGFSALHIASYSNNVQVVIELLKHPKVNPNAVTQDKKSTPLHVACFNNLATVVEILLQHSEINPNMKDVDGDTPLHNTVYRNNVPTLEVLLKDPRVDLNMWNRYGETALEVAVRERASPLVIRLLQAGIAQREREVVASLREEVKRIRAERDAAVSKRDELHAEITQLQQSRSDMSTTSTKLKKREINPNTDPTIPILGLTWPGPDNPNQNPDVIWPTTNLVAGALPTDSENSDPTSPGENLQCTPDLSVGYIADDDSANSEKNTGWLEGKQDDPLQKHYELVMRKMESTMQVCKRLLKLINERKDEIACCSMCQTEVSQHVKGFRAEIETLGRTLGAASRSSSPSLFDMLLPFTMSTDGAPATPSSGTPSSPFPETSSPLMLRDNEEMSQALLPISSFPMLLAQDHAESSIPAKFIIPDTTEVELCVQEDETPPPPPPPVQENSYMEERFDEECVTPPPPPPPDYSGDDSVNIAEKPTEASTVKDERSKVETVEKIRETFTANEIQH